LVKPYIDQLDVRTFYSCTPASDYVWHRDEEDRTIKVLSGEGWQLQIEDCLPFLLEKDLEINIPKMVYHRLIKGYNNLKVRIHVKI